MYSSGSSMISDLSPAIMTKVVPVPQMRMQTPKSAPNSVSISSYWLISQGVEVSSIRFRNHGFFHHFDPSGTTCPDRHKDTGARALKKPQSSDWLIGKESIPRYLVSHKVY
jgi:hypothetical protein